MQINPNRQQSRFQSRGSYFFSEMAATLPRTPRTPVEDIIATYGLTGDGHTFTGQLSRRWNWQDVNRDAFMAGLKWNGVDGWDGPAARVILTERTLTVFINSDPEA